MQVQVCAVISDEDRTFVLDGMAFWLAACAAAVFLGLGKGGVPMGASLAVPVLALVISPIAAAGLLLPVYLAADVVSLWAYRKAYNTQVLRIMLVAMPLGVLFGYLTVDLVSEAQVTLLLGLMGVVFAVATMLRRNVDTTPRDPRWRPGLFWGTIAGFTSFVSHSGAVPYQVFTLPLRLEKITFVGTLVIAFAYVNVVKLIPYYFLGQLSWTNLKTATILMVPAALAVLLGVKLVRIVPEKLFFRVVIWALLALSLKLMWDGAHQIFSFG